VYRKLILKMETFGKMCAMILMLIIGSLIGGFMFMKMYEWFIVYAFSVTKLNLIQSIGVSFFISYLKYKIDKKEGKKDFKESIGDFFEALIHLLVLFGLALIITLFQ